MGTGYGLEVYTKNNFLSLSSNFKQLSVIQSGVVTTPYGSYAELNLPSSSVFLISPITDNIVWTTFRFHPSGDLTTLRHRVTAFDDSLFDASASFRYLVLGLGPGAPSKEWGLQVFNSAGELVFDTNNIYSGSNSQVISIAANNVISVTKTPASGKNLYFTCSSLNVIGFSEQPQGDITFSDFTETFNAIHKTGNNYHIGTFTRYWSDFGSQSGSSFDINNGIDIVNFFEY